MRNRVVFYLNGERKEVQGDAVFSMLADWLRKDLELTGTKIVCAEGDCGACTLLRSFSADPDSEAPFEMMNSCISMVGQMDGCHLVTVEGVQEGAELSPVQKAMQDCHGSQCGYCTPGFVMALTAALEKNQSLNPKKASHYLTGNLCRCTGYQPILEAAASAKADPRFSIASRYLSREKCEILNEFKKESVRVEFEGHEFFAPTTLTEAIIYKNNHPGCRILGAGTDWGVQINKGALLSQKMLSLHLISELYQLNKNSSQVSLGARVTLSQIRKGLKKEHPEFSNFLDLFASPQIKNVATLVGNIANASPIGDTLPFLLVSNAKVIVSRWDLNLSCIQTREIALTDLYLGYKKLAIETSEIITHVSFDLPSSGDLFKLYKVSQRKDLDISTVSLAVSYRIDETSKKISSLKFAMGGVAATPIRLHQTEKVFKGKVFNQSLLQEGIKALQDEINPLADLRGSAQYRRVLAKNLLKRFSEEVWH